MTAQTKQQSKIQQIADKIKQIANKRIKKPLMINGMKEKKVIFHD